MATVKLGTKAIGSKISIKINGTARSFIVAHQGKPSSIYDSSFTDGTIVFMEDLYESRVWDSGDVNDYANSDIEAYLNGTFYNLIDPNVRSQIKQVKVPYRAGSGTSNTVSSGSSGLSCKVFLLSGYEVGSESSTYMPADGATLSYFSGIESAGSSSKRVARLNGSATGWWLRSPSTYYSDDVWCVIADGGLGSYDVALYSRGVRPALVLPSSLLVSDDGSITTNTAPTVPPDISIPATVNGGATITVSWSASSDADGNLSGYKVEKNTNGGTWSQIYQGTATSTTDTVAFGTTTVAYRVKAYDAEGGESTYQTSATKTVVNNVPPSVPSNLTVPATVIGGTSLTISWGASSDSDGNLTGYRLERSVNGAAYSQIYQGANLFYADSITKGWNTVTYRVKAYDNAGAESAYATGPSRTVDNTSPPVINSSTSGNIGAKSDGFTWQYTVTQAESTVTAVVETMDGAAIRSYTASLGAANTFDVTGTYFQGLSNGTHTMQVTATSGGKNTSYTVTFTKAVYALSITLKTPLPADGPITKMVMNITRSIPADATFQVLVTNNANDSSPVWEDATTSVKNGTNYLFSNTTLANEPAFNFKVTASRGPSNIGGFINSIGGAFE